MNEARAFMKTLAEEIASDFSENDDEAKLYKLASAALDELQMWRETFNDFAASIPVKTEKPSAVLEQHKEKMKQRRANQAEGSSYNFSYNKK